jgi:dienelactone hydrolase
MLPILGLALAANLVLAPQTSDAPPIEPATRALFDYDATLDLELEEVSVESFTGYDRVDLTYASPLGGRVPAYLYLPQTEGPWAGMLVMHGMPGNRENGRVMAEGYARGGAVCLAISAPWARLEPGEPLEPMTFTAQDRANQIQLIVDLRRGLDLLLTFPEVDPKRLGYVGGSYGGAMGGLLAGVERRIAAYALVVGDGGLLAHMTSPGDPIPPEGLTEDAWKAWVAAMEPIEPLRFVAHAAPAALLFQNGRTDELVPAADAEVYQAAGSEPKTILWYDGGHGIDGPRLRDQAKWFAERIGTDPAAFGG